MHGLYFAGDFQGNTRAFRDLDGGMCSLDRCEPSDEAQVFLLLLPQLVLRHINPVMDRAHPQHILLLSLKVADTNEMNIRIAGVQLAQGCLVGMMHRIHNRGGYERGTGKRLRGVEVDDITRLGSVANRPCGVIHILEHGGALAADRPLGLAIPSPGFDANRGFAIGVHDHFYPFRSQPFP